MKKQILLALMMMCATCAMAVKLPSSPYSSIGSSIPSSEGYSISNGTTFVNAAVVASGSGCVFPDVKDPIALDTKCSDCCSPVAEECMNAGGGWESCTSSSSDYTKCINDCTTESALGDSPIDASLLVLLMMVASYGVYTYYQKRKTA